MTQLIITLIVGVIGGTIALKYKVPAGAMVGSMFAVSIFSIITGYAFVPQNIKIVTQIAAGAFIGTGIKRKDVLELKLIIKPAIIMVFIMITLDLLMGYIMYKATGLDLITALFASAPAGIVDMSLISDDLGADTSKVAVLHLVRLVSVLTFFPPLMKYINDSLTNTKKMEKSNEVAACVNLIDGTIKSNESSKSKCKQKQDLLNLSITMALAFLAGLLGYSLKIPAGAMTFSMIAVGALNVFTARGFMPLNLRRLTQMFAGALIGSRVTYSDVIALKEIVLPAGILLFGILVINLVIGFIIYKTSRLELVTSLLASAPGGLSDMALIAKDLGADAPKVAILHLVRVVSIIGIFPILIKAITSQ